jgi:phospholipid-transporting ATPase
MITAAHVGVGIKGLEGQQAARAADYSIGEFKFLRRLLLYYGRESYRKNSTLICFNFYKNILLTMPIFWFGFWNGFSGQLIYDPWIFQFFNVFYASVPIIFFALFDEEFPDSNYLNIRHKEIKNNVKSIENKIERNRLEIEPKWYDLGREGKMFNVKVFWGWMINGFAHSVIVLFFW